MRSQGNFPMGSSCPRSNLAQEHCTVVDKVLKDLKSCTRRLHAALLSQHTELRILDQLYYKGNNQHRTALFWNRIEEVRRFGKRVEKLEVYDTVESLRVSFWTPQNTLTAKNVKGAWTHVPGYTAVQATLNRIKACKILMDKMHQCLTKTYDQLNLNMQTGAFLQLILTVTAITSRLAMLLDEVRTAVDAAWEACSQLLTILQAPGPSSTPTPNPPVTSLVSEDVEEAAVENASRLNQNISTFISSDTAGITQDIAPSITQQQDDDELVEVYSLSGTATSIAFRTLGGRGGVIPNPSIRRQSSQKAEQTNVAPKSTNPPRRIGKKKKRDAIDDIFGF
ncbi:hypothetical protein BXZ70DRAFT_914718 [Cristinia sonorae]|uniref:Nucleolus and neural progenitor protein-like N-terminal domain-containing protein n=1 Tax=Cristinia sonorae TaxID=1940300 RepID=A0A8K0UY29_9AGAR|nr:hypothetical protein BXZ70DRAFT_914718 [Cristinia sonorae]